MSERYEEAWKICEAEVENKRLGNGSQYEDDKYADTKLTIHVEVPEEFQESPHRKFDLYVDEDTAIYVAEMYYLTRAKQKFERFGYHDLIYKGKCVDPLKKFSQILTSGDLGLCEAKIQIKSRKF